jgi:hypothetical protein
MVVSNELVYAITRGKHSFLRKNLNNTYFSADPFSATNVPKASQPGLHTRGARGLAASDEQGKVIIHHFKSGRRITKKGKNNNRKSPSQTFASKTVDAKKNAGKGHRLLGKRGSKLQAVSQRIARLNKQTK